MEKNVFGSLPTPSSNFLFVIFLCLEYKKNFLTLILVFILDDFLYQGDVILDRKMFIDLLFTNKLKDINFALKHVYVDLMLFTKLKDITTNIMCVLQTSVIVHGDFSF
jgi:hypothetical protein